MKLVATNQRHPQTRLKCTFKRVPEHPQTHPFNVPLMHPQCALKCALDAPSNVPSMLPQTLSRCALDTPSNAHSRAPSMFSEASPRCTFKHDFKHPQTPSNAPSKVPSTHFFNTPSNTLNTLKCIPLMCAQRPYNIKDKSLFLSLN